MHGVSRLDLKFEIHFCKNLISLQVKLTVRWSLERFPADEINWEPLSSIDIVDWTMFNINDLNHAQAKFTKFVNCSGYIWVRRNNFLKLLFDTVQSVMKKLRNPKFGRREIVFQKWWRNNFLDYFSVQRLKCIRMDSWIIRILSNLWNSFPDLPLWSRVMDGQWRISIGDHMINFIMELQ